MISTRNTTIERLWNLGERFFVPFIRYGAIIVLCLSIILSTILSAASHGAAAGIQIQAAQLSLFLIRAGFPLIGIGFGFIGLLILPKTDKVFLLFLMIAAALITATLT